MPSPDSAGEPVFCDKNLADVARFKSERTFPILGCMADALGRGGFFFVGASRIDWSFSFFFPESLLRLALLSSLSFLSSRFWRCNQSNGEVSGICINLL